MLKYKPVSVSFIPDKFLLKDVITYAESKSFPLLSFPSLMTSISLQSLEPLLEKVEEEWGAQRVQGTQNCKLKEC